MKKQLIIPLVSFGVILASAASIALFNNKGIIFTKVEAAPVSLVFNSDSVDPDFIDDQSDEYYKYIEFYMSVETPLHNTFETNIDATYPQVGADTFASVKTNNRILELEDSSGYGYFSINFKFKLSIVTFDHITVHGYFDYGNSHTKTDYLTYDDVEDTGFITVSLQQINEAYISTIDVVYSC